MLLLDKRDKILKDYVDGVTRNQQELSMELSLRAITTEKRRNSKTRKGSKTYLELPEKSCSGSSKEISRTRVSSSPCLQNYYCEMEHIDETTDSQEIELATLNNNDIILNEASQSTKPDTYETRHTSDGTHDDSSKQNLLAGDWQDCPFV